MATALTAAVSSYNTHQSASVWTGVSFSLRLRFPDETVYGVSGWLGRQSIEKSKMDFRVFSTLQLYSLRSKRSGIVEIKSQKHGCSIGSSTPNPPIKAPEARSPFPDFFYRGLYYGWCNYYKPPDCPSLNDEAPEQEHVSKI